MSAANIQQFIRKILFKIYDKKAIGNLVTCANVINMKETLFTHLGGK